MKAKVNMNGYTERGENIERLLGIKEILHETSKNCKITFFNLLNENVSQTFSNVLNHLMEELLLSYQIESFPILNDKEVESLFYDGINEGIFASLSGTITACFLILDNEVQLLDDGVSECSIDNIYNILFHVLMFGQTIGLYDEYVDEEMEKVNRLLLVITDAFGDTFRKINIGNIDERFKKWNRAINFRVVLNSFMLKYVNRLKNLG